jgi:hypothetical protein
LRGRAEMPPPKPERWVLLAGGSLPASGRHFYNNSD